jgi:DNA invertase Pin-like site-specific DNA recombinase
LKNTESTQRQYALRDQAVALGWPIERVHTIDEDLGRSGARTQDRGGFQYLVSEVALGHAGIVLGLEVSRLARNNADWRRLLELCALAGCLIADEEGVSRHCEGGLDAASGFAPNQCLTGPARPDCNFQVR